MTGDWMVMMHKHAGGFVIQVVNLRAISHIAPRRDDVGCYDVVMVSGETICINRNQCDELMGRIGYSRDAIASIGL